MQRRTLLKLGATTAALLAVVGGTAALIQPGLERGALTAAGREVFRAIGMGVLDKTLPEQIDAKKESLTGLLSRIDVLVSALPPHAQAELSQLLSILATGPGRLALAGLGTPWASASIPDVQAALQDMRFSRLAVRQQAYAALHDITAGAYFSEPATWAFLGYPGPLKI
ncbi:MAG: hypothetical protein HQ446_08260 [Polaromonas sp.]|nr:hypothetical protein [Polaromonas sp.]